MLDSEHVIWQDRAPCHGVPDEYFMKGPASELALKQKFISDYCEVCPVAQQCLDEGLKNNDMDYTVRGGYLPILQAVKPVGRQVGHKVQVIRYGKGSKLLENGVCGSGLHVILSEDDIKFYPGGKAACLECYNMNNRGEKRPKRQKWGKNGFCPNGHAVGEKEQTYFRCNTCQRIREAANKAAKEQDDV